MFKSKIRSFYREKRQALEKTEVLKLSDLMLILFQQTGIDIPATIMTYAAMEERNEFDPGIITDYCQFVNPVVRLAYPVMEYGRDNTNISAFVVNKDTGFVQNKWGIAEPVNGTLICEEDIEMVITPLLAFDREGNRVGYGKGYYDRFLSRCKSNCLKIGFSYFEPLDRIDDADSFDIKLDLCVTPERIYYFTN